MLLLLIARSEQRSPQNRKSAKQFYSKKTKKSTSKYQIWKISSNNVDFFVCFAEIIFSNSEKIKTSSLKSLLISFKNIFILANQI